MNDGIRCIANATSCCQMLNPGANESNANMLIKVTAITQSMRGIQCIKAIDVFITVFLTQNKRNNRSYYPSTNHNYYKQVIPDVVIAQ
jgi:hypothetical protein